MIELGKHMVARDPIPSKSGKTLVWVISSHSGGALGQVKWFSAWRCYVYEPMPWTVYNADCMQALSDFTQCVTAAHKAAQSAAKGGGK